MPRAPKVCRDCTALTTTGPYCDAHRPMNWVTSTRPATTHAGRVKRREVLERDPVCTCTWCRKCSRDGCSRPSTEDDHALPYSQGGSDDIANHRGMCGPCHRVKTLDEATAGRRRVQTTTLDSLTPSPGPRSVPEEVGRSRPVRVRVSAPWWHEFPRQGLTPPRPLHALVIAAPEDLRALLRGTTTTMMVQTAARLRTRSGWDAQTVTTANVLRTLARRVLALQGEARDHETTIGQIVRDWRPDLLTQPGIGVITAAQVLIAWSHPGRIRSEAAFAMLAGTAPIPASSGMTTRHRLNRSGARQLNRALHVIALSRTRYDQRTRDYIDHRRAQGKTDREIRRCLKRYIARDLFRQLKHGALPA